MECFKISVNEIEVSLILPSLHSNKLQLNTLQYNTTILINKLSLTFGSNKSCKHLKQSLMKL